MNPDILKLGEILDAEHPVPLASSARPYTISALKSVGWEEGWKIPGGLKEYFAGVFDALGLPHSSESLQHVVGLQEVQLTLQKKIQRVYEKEHAEEIAQQQVKDLLGDTSGINGEILETLKQGAIEAAVKRSEIPAPEEKKEEEDFSDLETPEPKAPPKPQRAYCPCCNWDLSQEYHTVEKDPDDARNFLLYVLGGPSFKKEFTLWNGLCTVTFQTIGNAEEELFSEQYGIDYAENKMNISSLVQHNFNKYHLALSLYSIKFHGAKQDTEIPSIWSPMFDPVEGKSRLRQFMEKWYNVHIKSFELQKMLFDLLMDFNHYVDSLSKELYRKDFWTGVTTD